MVTDESSDFSYIYPSMTICLGICDDSSLDLLRNTRPVQDHFEKDLDQILFFEKDLDQDPFQITSEKRI